MFISLLFMGEVKDSCIVPGVCLTLQRLLKLLESEVFHETPEASSNEVRCTNYPARQTEIN